jgi:hypothetical protein
MATHTTVVVPTGKSVGAAPPKPLGYTGTAEEAVPSCAEHAQRGLPVDTKLQVAGPSTVSAMVMVGKSTVVPGVPGEAKRDQGRPPSAIATVGGRASRQAPPSAVKPSEQWHTAVPLTLMQSELAGQPEVLLAHSSMSGQRWGERRRVRRNVRDCDEREWWRVRAKGSTTRPNSPMHWMPGTAAPAGSS